MDETRKKLVFLSMLNKYIAVLGQIVIWSGIITSVWAILNIDRDTGTERVLFFSLGFWSLCFLYYFIFKTWKIVIFNPYKVSEENIDSFYVKKLKDVYHVTNSLPLTYIPATSIGVLGVVAIELHSIGNFKVLFAGFLTLFALVFFVLLWRSNYTRSEYQKLTGKTLIGF